MTRFPAAVARLAAGMARARARQPDRARRCLAWSRHYRLLFLRTVEARDKLRPAAHEYDLYLRANTLAVVYYQRAIEWTNLANGMVVEAKEARRVSAAHRAEMTGARV